MVLTTFRDTFIVVGDKTSDMILWGKKRTPHLLLRLLACNFWYDVVTFILSEYSSPFPCPFDPSMGQHAAQFNLLLLSSQFELR